MKKILVISTLAIILSVSIVSVYAQNQYEIPSWVKGVAGFWAEGKISDADFGEGLAFLIDNEIIKVPKIQELQDKVSTLQSENADLRSKLNLPEPDDALGPEDCTSNQVWQDNQCVTVSELSNNNLNLQTDKVLYEQGDVVVITGLIHNIENLSTGDVAIIGRGPDNNNFLVAQVHPNADGSFQTSFKADGPQFIVAGNYTIFVNFSGLKSQITFEFAGGNGNIISDSFMISVTTDKSYYKYGDTIKISGQVSDIFPNVPVTLIVIAPNGDTVDIAQINIGSDKKFSIALHAGSEVMKDSGIYTAQVSYGGGLPAKTTFTFNGVS